jgi:hypothetical protein
MCLRNMKSISQAHTFTPLFPPHGHLTSCTAFPNKSPFSSTDSLALMLIQICGYTGFHQARASYDRQTLLSGDGTQHSILIERLIGTLAMLVPSIRLGISSRPDILVNMEEIVWIVLGFELGKAGIVIAICRFHAVFAFIHDHVDVGAACGKWVQSQPVIF